MYKKILCIVFVVITVFLFTVSATALSATSYGDLPSTSSQATNLITYAMSFDDFITSDYVCFRDDLNSYYCVWSDDITWSGSTISADDIKYVRYWRSSNTSSWQYGYGSDTSFSFSTAYLITSNVPGLGSTSSVFETFYFQHNFMILGIVFTSFLMVIAFISLRGGKE